jgi:hypothetical protein
VADGAWSTSGCRADVKWYGYPGQGAYYWTARFGTIWVGATHATYAATGYECGGLGAPVKPYQWLTEFAAYGQWFEGGAIFYRSGRWQVAYGNFGQTAGRLAGAPEESEAPADAERPYETNEAPWPPKAPTE